MTPALKFPFGLLAAAAFSAWAQHAHGAEPQPRPDGGTPPYVPAARPQPPAAETGGTWADRRRQDVRTTLGGWAHNMDGWFGEPDPDNPAAANLRLTADGTWNKHDGFSVKPRLRGKLKLPVLQKRLNVMFGDDTLDSEPQQTGHLYDESAAPHQKTFSKTETRDSNSSLALRWSDIGRRTGIDTDADVGIRSGSDLFVRLKAGKSLDLGRHRHTRIEQVYRYGLKSGHHARTNWELRRGEAGKPFAANHFHIEYNRKKEAESWSWGNSLYRQHDFPGHKRLNYGLYAGGDIKSRKMKLNSYGPFAGWRQPVWREWLFVQPEINYLNNRKENRTHHIGALVRVEALF